MAPTVAPDCFAGSAWLAFRANLTAAMGGTPALAGALGNLQTLLTAFSTGKAALAVVLSCSGSAVRQLMLNPTQAVKGVLPSLVARMQVFIGQLQAGTGSVSYFDMLRALRSPPRLLHVSVCVREGRGEIPIPHDCFLLEK